MQVFCPPIREQGSRVTTRTRWTPLLSNLKSRYRFEGRDRVDQERLKWRGAVDTLCRGEVAEWLNAAVSKTVTSVIPASGVRIPPSPPFEATGFGKNLEPDACNLMPLLRMMLSMVRGRFGWRYKRA